MNGFGMKVLELLPVVEFDKDNCMWLCIELPWSERYSVKTETAWNSYEMM